MKNVRAFWEKSFRSGGSTSQQNQTDLYVKQYGKDLAGWAREQDEEFEKKWKDIYD
jgi:hypothetical protein